VGLLDLVTSVLPPPKDHLGVLLRLAPLVVTQAAAALVALCGLVLLALVGRLRRGQHRAWTISSLVSVVTALLHLARGLDAVQCALGLALFAALMAARGAFRGATEPTAGRSGLLLILGGLLATVAGCSASIETFLALDPDQRSLPVHQAVVGVAERLVGVQTVALPERLNRFVSPTLLGVGLATAVLAVLVASRPLVDRRQQGGSREQARRLVGVHGGGTLDYFALRDDKVHHFTGETLITYAVHGGICLVSPDPIGPPDDRLRAWAAFCEFVDNHGWVVAVLAADDSWLPVYRSAGLHALYIGDEAVVRLADFDLAGGRRKGLRQAVNRIKRHGYQVSFHDPRQLDPALRESLRALMARSRRGERERGFSMTLGRIFDPADTDLLLAVATDQNGDAVAFCHFVPAPAIYGYSLDLMRRDFGDHPNGLIDFLIVSTIEHLRSKGMEALALNFAAMRGVVAGETMGIPGARVLRTVLKVLSRSMQIESLWRFTAKYEPQWVRRHLVYPGIEHLGAVGLAIARAESMWELPVVGRYLASTRSGALGQRAEGRAA